MTPGRGLGAEQGGREEAGKSWVSPGRTVGAGRGVWAPALLVGGGKGKAKALGFLVRLREGGGGALGGEGGHVIPGASPGASPSWATCVRSSWGPHALGRVVALARRELCRL